MGLEHYEVTLENSEASYTKELMLSFNDKEWTDLLGLAFPLPVDHDWLPRICVHEEREGVCVCGLIGLL